LLNGLSGKAFEASSKKPTRVYCRAQPINTYGGMADKKACDRRLIPFMIDEILQEALY
jgi:hypothetical protein